MPTVVAEEGRQPFTASTAAASITADSTGVAHTGRLPLPTASAVSVSATVRDAVPVSPFRSIICASSSPVRRNLYKHMI